MAVPWLFRCWLAILWIAGSIALTAAEPSTIPTPYASPLPLESDTGINVEPLIKDALNGDRISQMTLGILYEQHSEYTNAYRWFRKAADLGLPEAQFKVGFYHTLGRAVLRDYTEAMDWYAKAARQGLPDAQYSLGVCFENGFGVAKQYGEALKWYRLAADANYASAQKAVGVFYELGYGTNIDLAEAAAWYSLAEMRREPAAIILKKRLWPRLSENQQAVAQQRAQFLDTQINARQALVAAQNRAAMTAGPRGTNAPAATQTAKPKAADFLQ